MLKHLLVLFLYLVSSFALAAPATKPIVLWVPFGPGGISGNTAVGLQKMIKEVHPGDVVVRYQPGAGGLVGINKWYETDDNNINLLVTNDRIPIGNFLTKDLPDNFYQQVKPLAFLGYSQYIIHGSTGLNSKSLKTIDQSGKTHLSFGFQGNGSFGHLIYLIMKPYIKAEIVTVPYQGTARALSDLIGGHVDMAIGFESDSVDFANSGRSIPLAVSGSVPSLTVAASTFKEQNINGMPPGSFFAVFDKLGSSAADQEYVQTLLYNLFVSSNKSKLWQQSASLTAPSGDEKVVRRWWDSKIKFYKNLEKNSYFDEMRAPK